MQTSSVLITVTSFVFKITTQIPHADMYMQIIPMAESLIKSCKIIFAEYRLTKRIMSDVDTNFVSEKLRLLQKTEHGASNFIILQSAK